jgi:hypothetical protein
VNVVAAVVGLIERFVGIDNKDFEGVNDFSIEGK